MIQNKVDDRLMILLEGNIGAGKTTVGRALAASGAFEFIEEPTTTWQKGFAANMLDLFYSDPHRWGFTFQICAFITGPKRGKRYWRSPTTAGSFWNARFFATVTSLQKTVTGRG